MKKKQFSNSMTQLFLFVFLFGVFNFSLLTFNLETAEASAVSLGIYPPTIQATAKLPAVISAPITIKNTGKETVELVVGLKPFEAKAENGQVSYLKNDNYSALFDQIRLKDKDEIVNSLKLAPNQEKKLDLVINLHTNQPASDYYFSVIFTTVSNSQNSLNNSQNKIGIATNVLLSVNPKVRAQADLIEFSSPRLLEGGPVPFTVRVENTGSHFITPKGQIVIKNIFGQEIGIIDLLQANILKGATRNIPDKKEVSEAVWSEKNLFGPYWATLTLKLSEQGPVIKRTIYFIGFPTKLFLGFAVAIFMVILVLNRLRLRQI